MRGLGNEYSLILIDGRRQSTSSRRHTKWFWLIIQWFFLQAAIERIEVIRGP